MQKLKATLALVAMVAATSFVAAQASVTGTWAGEVQGGRGTQQVTLTLKADSGKVTGTVNGGRGGDVAIEEGTVSGDTVKFKTKQQGRGGEVVLSWTGTLKGDELAMSRAAEGGQGQAQTFTLKRK